MASKSFSFVFILFSMLIVSKCKVHRRTMKAISSPSCAVPVKRIIGGETASPNQFPWQAQILRLDRRTNRFVHKCGGALYDAQWVITAGHCVFDQEQGALKVKLGEHERDKPNPLEQEFTVAVIHIHSRFLADAEYAYDIAILKLDRPAVFTNAVHPICLPKLYDQVPVGQECFLTGWGMTVHSHAAEKANLLHLIRLPVVSHQDCITRNSKLHNLDRFSNLCAGVVDGQTRSGCHGDSGGPLTCQDGSMNWELQGVVSWGDDKCGNQYYSVFTRVSSFIDWIENKMAAAPLQKPSTCTDTHYYCQEWKDKGWCDITYFEHMLKEYYCKKTCAACCRGESSRR